MNNTKEKAVEAMRDYLDSLEDFDLLTVWNEYTEDTNGDDMIWPMWELSDLMCGLSFADALDKLDLNNFSLSDAYLYDSIYGLRSTSDLSDIIEVCDIMDHIIWQEGDIADYYPELQKVAAVYNEATEGAENE